MTSPIVTPSELPKSVEGIEILSQATEKLREQQVENLKSMMEDFYKSAGLVDVMFLNDCLFGWYQEKDTITRRCLIADIVLDRLGYRAEKFSREEIELPRR